MTKQIKSIMKKENSDKPSSKVVSFNPKVKARIGKKLTYTTQEEKESLWYSKRDYDYIKMENKITTCIITTLKQKGEFKEEEEEQDDGCIIIDGNTFCFRGLEYFVTTKSSSTQQLSLRRKLSIMAVLQEQMKQSQQQQYDEPNDVRIAKAYSMFTDYSRNEAYKNGLYDQKFVLTSMKSTKRTTKSKMQKLIKKSSKQQQQQQPQQQQQQQRKKKSKVRNTASSYRTRKTSSLSPRPLSPRPRSASLQSIITVQQEDIRGPFLTI